jgi:hypothetical protein
LATKNESTLFVPFLEKIIPTTIVIPKYAHTINQSKKDKCI